MLLHKSYYQEPKVLLYIELPLLSKEPKHYMSEKIIKPGLNNNNTNQFLVVWKHSLLDEATWELYESLVPGG